MKDLINDLNNANEDDKQAALLNAVSTVLHETVHYGDWQDGNKDDNKESMTIPVVIDGVIQQRGRLVGDKGHAFENEVYFNGDDENTIDSISKAKVVIEKGERDLVPTVPTKY